MTHIHATVINNDRATLLTTAHTVELTAATILQADVAVILYTVSEIPKMCRVGR